MKHGKLLAAGAVCAAGILAVGLMTGAKPQEGEIIKVDSRAVVETTSPQIGDIIVNRDRRICGNRGAEPKSNGIPQGVG